MNTVSIESKANWLRSFFISLFLIMLSACSHRFFVPHYLEDYHVDEVIQVMVDQYFLLKPSVGNSVLVNPNFGYSELLATKFRAKGYSVSESDAGYRLEFHPHESEKESDTHTLVASLNRNGQSRFNMLFEIHGGRVIAGTTSVQQL